MGYVVELPVDEAGFTERMNQMRAWLDHARYEPSRFRFSSADARPIGCRVHFKTEDEAAAFARQFGGRVLIATASDAVII